jgi:hypothetical protein
VPVPSGTATPWREVEGPPEEGGSRVVYFRPGLKSGTADLLAEQLRADGVVSSLGPAIRIASEARLQVGWYGRNEDGEDRLCDQDGWTGDGALLEGTAQCITAVIDRSGD